MPKNTEEDKENTILRNMTAYHDTHSDEDTESINNLYDEENSFNFTIEEKVILGNV